MGKVFYGKIEYRRTKSRRRYNAIKCRRDKMSHRRNTKNNKYVEKWQGTAEDELTSELFKSGKKGIVQTNIHVWKNSTTCSEFLIEK